ncbi:hypothetical protein [Citrobacter sp. JGM124]|uniref:hypothetical protein n=1 Tax=Citrobacter sp. JGM124 TaxID=2799789 RepID=UPI001BA987ED|nr:hypothetical protein [Citrobacter sp. JGM124]MBS0847608.1 hypothetical protein [Citrobacter sp. JGM124]
MIPLKTFLIPILLGYVACMSIAEASAVTLQNQQQIGIVGATADPGLCALEPRLAEKTSRLAVSSPRMAATPGNGQSSGVAVIYQ